MMSANEVPFEIKKNVVAMHMRGMTGIHIAKELGTTQTIVSKAKVQFLKSFKGKIIIPGSFSEEDIQKKMLEMDKFQAKRLKKKTAQIKQLPKPEKKESGEQAFIKQYADYIRLKAMELLKKDMQ